MRTFWEDEKGKQIEMSAKRFFGLIAVFVAMVSGLAVGTFTGVEQGFEQLEKLFSTPTSIIIDYEYNYSDYDYMK